MPLCRGLARVIMTTLLLAGVAALVYYSMPRDTGSLASWLLVYGASAAAGALVYIAVRLLNSLILGLFSILSIGQAAGLAGPAGHLSLVPVASSIAVLAASAARFQGPDSIVELARGAFRPTPIIAALLVTLLIYSSGIWYTSSIGAYVHVSSSLLGGLIYARLSRSIVESLLSGLLLGLGPIGALLALAPQAYRSLPPMECRGIEVGRLVGYLTKTSPTRSVVIASQGHGIACSSGPAILSLEEPWVIWLYSTKPLNDALQITEGSRLVLDLVAPGPGMEGAEAEVSNASLVATRGGTGIARLGGVEPKESRLALASAVASSNIRAEWLIVVGSPLMMASLLELVASARHPRIVVALEGLPGGKNIAPPIPGKTVGLVIASLSDPGEQEHVARSLLGSRVTVLRRLFDYGLYLGYPYCSGLVMAFMPRAGSVNNL